MTINTTTAAKKTIIFKESDWIIGRYNVDNTTNSNNTTISLKLTYKQAKKVSTKPYIYINSFYQYGDSNKTKKYYKSISLSVQTKKKFKGTKFFLYDETNNKLKKILTIKAKKSYISYLNVGSYEKGYITSVYKNINHNIICKKLIIYY